MDQRGAEIVNQGDTEKWACRQPGFYGTAKQLTCCGRCGEPMRGGPHKPFRIFHALKPDMHWLCDECFEKLPD